MSQDHFGHQEQAREGMSIKSKAGPVLIGFLIIAGALLFTEHRAHVLGLRHGGDRGLVSRFVRFKGELQDVRRQRGRHEAEEFVGF